VGVWSMRIGKLNINIVNSCPPAPIPPAQPPLPIENNPYVERTYRASFTKQELINSIQILVTTFTFLIVGSAYFFVFRALGIEDYNVDVFAGGVIVASIGTLFCIILYSFWIRDNISELKWDWNVLHKLGYYRHWHLAFAETDYDKMRRENRDGRLPRPEEEADGSLMGEM